MFTWWFPLQALWLFLPAYIANMAPVFLSKLFPKWNAPIDGGRTGKDGVRLLGDGKTWRGLIGGAVVAALAALLLAHARFWDGFTDYAATETGFFWAPLVIGFAFGLGALVGDAVKSYFKRRSGRERGRPWIGPDQLDFVVGGLLLAAIAGWLLPAQNGDWTQTWLIQRWWIPLFIVVVTPLLHWLVNVLGYALKLKKEPW